MKRDRFSLIMKFFHLADNEQYIPKGQPGHDPIFKLRPFLEPLIGNFQQSYTLHRELSIDEAMVRFKIGWLSSCISNKVGDEGICVELGAIHR